MFEIQTFSNSSDAEVVDKAISAVGVIQGQFNEESGILNPVFIIESETIPTFNYCKIPAFGNRFYSVDGDIVAVSYNLWRINLKHDPLMNWKGQFRQLDAIIARQESSKNPYLADGLAPIEANSQLYVTKKFSRGLSFSTKNNVLLVTSAAIGGLGGDK